MIFKLRADFAAVMLVEGSLLIRQKHVQIQLLFNLPVIPRKFTRASSGFTEQVSSIMSIRVCLSIHPAISAWNTDRFCDIV